MEWEVEKGISYRQCFFNRYSSEKKVWSMLFIASAEHAATRQGIDIFGLRAPRKIRCAVMVQRRTTVVVRISA